MRRGRRAARPGCRRGYHCHVERSAMSEGEQIFAVATCLREIRGSTPDADGHRDRGAAAAALVGPCDDRIARGFRHVRARHILARLRWETDVAEDTYGQVDGETTGLK